MKRLLILIFLLIPVITNAQNNVCDGATPTDTVIATSIAMVVPEFALNNPSGQPIVSGFTFNALDGTAIVATAVVAKSNFTLQAGTPASCYKGTFPAFSGLIQNKPYKVSVIINGPVNSLAGVSSQSFFLPAAPNAPTNLRLLVLNTLSKMYQRVWLTLGLRN